MQDIMMQQQSAESQNEIEKAEEERKDVLKRIMTDEARERLARIRLVKPEFAQQIENQLISLAQSGRLRSKVDDETLKRLLQQLQPDREMNIKRIEK
jgi:programmed cell death protein 5